MRYCGATLCGFDTGHPALVLRYEVENIRTIGPAVTGERGAESGPDYFSTFGQYIPLDGSVEDSLAGLRRAIKALDPNTTYDEGDRPLTALVDGLVRGTVLRGLALRSRLRIVVGHTSNGRRFAKHVWGNRTPLDYALDDLIDTANSGATLTVEGIKSIFARWGIFRS